MSASEMIDTGVALPRMSKARVILPASVEVAWAEGYRSGRMEIIDLAPALGSFKIYRPLRGNPELMATARLIEDGDAIAWGDGNIDMSAEMIENLAAQAMTPEDFSSFLQRNHLTQAAAAALLGRSRRQIGYYLKPGPVPRIVALACIGYEALSARRGIDAA